LGQIDIALIPIHPPHLSRNANFLYKQKGKKKLSAFDLVEGVSYRELGLVPIYGKLFEHDEINHSWQADSQGTHGFSGAGLYYMGKLAAMHQGAGNFKHFFSAYKQSLDKLYSATQKLIIQTMENKTKSKKGKKRAKKKFLHSFE